MIHPTCKLLVLLLLLLATHANLRAEEPPVKTLILPGESFLIEGRPAFILWPAVDKRRQPQPWVMYAPTLPAYPDQHEKWIHQQLLDAGVAVAGIDVGEAYGSPFGQRMMDALYQELTEKRGFAKKPCLLARSRGGLWDSSWAIANPDKVAGLAGIYPAFDLRTYPGLKRAAPAYEMTPEQLEASLDKNNPIARIDVLAQAKIPMCIIHGSQDTVVPLKENSGEVVRHYEQQGEADLIRLIAIQNQGHNFWPGFFHCDDVVQFAISRAKSPGKTPNSEKKDFVTLKDLPYVPNAGDSQLLDLYLPLTAKQKTPVVVWVHGGGWKQGSKDRCQASWMVANGYAVASINYRLLDEGQWPAQIDDCRAAIRWLRVNAKEFNLDAEHIGVWGGSAGGHLVALMGTLDTPADEKISSRVQAVCDWYGPSDLLTMPPNVLSAGRTEEDLAKSNGARLLGGTVRDRPELAKQASALYQVSKNDAPFLIMHGDKDPGVPLDQSQRLNEKLQAAGVPTSLFIVEGAGHGGKQFQTPEVKERVLSFFNEYLRPAVTETTR
ncbi:prolyl oligopeptidase family serine peptidase [bacterium]|nr:prolyl oligopeptidase family serine peptidase [bacterium]